MNSAKIEIYLNVLERIESLCKLSHPLETGGCLVGTYPDSWTVRVEDIIPPTPDSIGTATSFFRGTEGLKETLHKLWPDSYYIGEWHYHPSHTIEISGPDLDAFIAISHDQAEKCPCPIMIIFGLGGIFRVYSCIDGKVEEVVEQSLLLPSAHVFTCANGFISKRINQ